MGFAIAGAAIAGAAISSNASSNAANAETGAANNATAAQMAMYNQNVALNKPFYDSGVANLNTLNSELPTLNSPFSMADFQADPGYQMRIAQGNKAIQQSAAARGSLLGGDTLKALTNYNSDAAANEYQQAFQNYNTTNSNTFNRLSQMAGIGQTAAAQNQAAGTNAANNISQNTIAAGNASAANSVSTANSINSAIGTGMNSWMMNQYLNRNPTTTAPPTTPTSMSSWSTGPAPVPMNAGIQPADNSGLYYQS